MNYNLTIAILSGGKSSRFGTNKIYAEYKGVKLIDRAITIAKSISNDIILVGDYSHIDIPNYQDEYKERGPLGAIHSAIKNSNKNYVAILPVDMPEMIPEIYRILLSYSKEINPVVAISDIGLEPLVSIWHKNNLSLIENKLVKNLNSPIDVLNELNAIKIEITKELDDYNSKYFHNINYQIDIDKYAEQ